MDSNILDELVQLGAVQEPVSTSTEEPGAEGAEPTQGTQGTQSTQPTPNNPTGSTPVENEEGEESSTQTSTEEAEEAEEDLVGFFKKELGVDADIKGDTVETLLEVAKTAVNQYKEKAAVLENPEIGRVVEFLMNGGTLEEYVSTPQPSNFFANFNAEEDEIDKVEEFVRYSLQQRQMDEEDIQEIISKRKDNGTLYAYFQRELKYLREQEAAVNAQIQEEFELTQRQRQEEAKAWFDEQAQYFGELTGIETEADIVEKAKDLSLPDNKGLIKISEIIEKLSASDHAKINIFVTALAEGKSFRYTPNKLKPASVKNRPIASLVNSTKKDKPVQATLQDLELKLRQ